MTVQEIYEQTIKPLPPQDRLRLASFILNDITGGKIDVSDAWSDEDLRDVAAAGWKHIDAAFPNPEGCQPLAGG